MSDLLIQDRQGPRLYPAWRQLERDLLDAGLKDGEVIPMQYLRDKLGLEDPAQMTCGADAVREQARFNFAVGYLSASLLESHRIMLRVVDGVGYLVVPPREQTKTAVKDRGAEIRNIMSKAMSELKNVRMELLTRDQQRENADALARMASIQSHATPRLRR